MRTILTVWIVSLIFASGVFAGEVVDDFESYTGSSTGDKPLDWYWTVNGDDVSGEKVTLSTTIAYDGIKSLKVEWGGTLDGEWDTVAVAVAGWASPIVNPINTPGVIGVKFAFKGDLANDPDGFLQMTLFGVGTYYYPVYDENGELIRLDNPDWQVVVLDLGFQLSGCWGVQFEMAGLAKKDPTNGGIGYFDRLETISAPPVCGDSTTVYKSGDANKDCYVNMLDFVEIAAHWLQCSDPDEPDCDQYWR